MRDRSQAASGDKLPQETLWHVFPNYLETLLLWCSNVSDSCLHHSLVHHGQHSRHCPPVQPPVKRFKSLPSLGLIEDLNSDGTCEPSGSLTKTSQSLTREPIGEKNWKKNILVLELLSPTYAICSLNYQVNQSEKTTPSRRCLNLCEWNAWSLAGSKCCYLEGPSRSITRAHWSLFESCRRFGMPHLPEQWREISQITKAKGRQRFEFRKHEIREVLDTLHLTSAITKEEEGISRTLAIKNLWKIATNPNGCHQVSLQPPQVFAPVPLSASRGGHIKSWQSCRIIFHCFILLHIFMRTHHSASCLNKNHGKLKTQALPHCPCCIKNT